MDADKIIRVDEPGTAAGSVDGPRAAPGRARPGLLGPGLLLGVGLGGFVDGILLHQILDWHHLLSSRSGDVRLNMLADGLFHAATWIAVVIGLFWLWRRRAAADPAAGQVSTGALTGALLAGWGLFNLVEGLVDHHLLAVHHVRPGPHQTAYDVGFLVVSALLVALGALLYRRASRPR